MEKAGYEVRVFDLINPDTSFGYNPFEYVKDDKDVLKLITNLIRKDRSALTSVQSSAPFFSKASFNIFAPINPNRAKAIQ